MLGNDEAPTRSAILQMRDEHEIVLEAYDFLDEKRLLLAAELLRQLGRYEDLLQQYDAVRERAERILVATIRRHGLQGAQVYPGCYLQRAELRTTSMIFMGVKLLTTELHLPEELGPGPICQPSPEAEQCRREFLELARLGAVLAGVSGNLHRLLSEYRKTERRARALENVVIPEMTHKLHDMSSRLEELDQEDVVRVHMKVLAH
jgi:V/A-type H+/Na+-transporting ATPase subunit D